MPEKTDTAPREFAPVVDRLNTEFSGVHMHPTVFRCVEAAWYGARETTGKTSPDLVECIARQHLQVLALAFAERR